MPAARPVKSQAELLRETQAKIVEKKRAEKTALERGPEPVHLVDQDGKILCGFSDSKNHVFGTTSLPGCTCQACLDIVQQDLGGGDIAGDERLDKVLEDEKLRRAAQQGEDLIDEQILGRQLENIAVRLGDITELLERIANKMTG
jgi:hypothetical protein